MPFARFLLSVSISVCLCSLVRAAEIWTVHHGQTVIHFNNDVLSEHGLSIANSNQGPIADGNDVVHLNVLSNEEPVILDSQDGQSAARSVVAGEIHHADGLIISTRNKKFIIDDFTVDMTATRDAKSANLLLQAPDVVVDKGNVVVECDDVIISQSLASALGDASLSNLVIGSLATSVALSRDSFDVPAGNIFPAGGGPATVTACQGSTGPDVIVGDVVVDTGSNFASVGGIDAFAWGTTSCNMGTQQLQWQSGNSNHPVIAQNLYRLMTVNGAPRFEHVGLGWLKHGFTALSGSLCCSCQGGGGSVLGIGCSDPYSSSLNGTQCSGSGQLGPRFQVNAHTGGFIFPFMFRSNCTYIPHTSITRRCQAFVSDLDPALNSGALYYAEGQYVTPDDATAKNQDNNCSYERVNLSSAGNATSAGATVRELPAIKAWKTADPTVTETTIPTPEAANAGGDTSGTCILSAKATQISGNVYRYEYAMYNMNSDRCISSFSVPTPTGLTISNVGFHDPFYHDGDGFNSSTTNIVTFDGTDWASNYDGNSMTWSVVLVTPPENSNVIRWGTLYNFRFDCNAAPVSGNISLGLFKPVSGQPNSINTATVVPDPTVPCQSPQISAVAGQYAACGVPFSLTVAVSGTPPFDWALNNAPAGMTIDIDGQINWPNPVNSDDSYQVEVSASSTCGTSVDAELVYLRVTQGDFNADGSVNELDSDIFVSQLLDLAPVTPCNSDLNNDGFADGLDIEQFLALLGIH